MHKFTLAVLGLAAFVLGLVGCGQTSSTTAPTSPTSTPTLKSITLTSTTQSLLVNGTVQFTATGSYSDGSNKNLTSLATWSSSSANVASIVSGLATGIASGNTTISASTGGVTGSKTLTVSPILTSIAVTPAAPSVTVDTTQQFTATGTFTDGSAQDLTDQVAWASSSSSVGSIDKKGLATTAAKGTTTVSASMGAIAGSAALTVTSATLTSIFITPDKTSVPQGATQLFVAGGVFSDGSTQILAAVVWASSDPKIVSIDNTGVAAALSAASVTISATSAAVTGTTTFTVLPAALVSISLSPSAPSLALGNTTQFTAVGLFTDGSTQNISAATWSSSNTTSATVDNTGFASTLTAGSTAISATSGSVTGSTVLTVTSAVILSITVTPASPSVPVGSLQQFTASGMFSDGSTEDITDTGTWTSSAGNVATISNSGLATTLAIGSTTLTASMGSLSGSTDLQVTAASLQSISVTPANLPMATGTTAQLTATGSYSDGSSQDLTSVATWSSSAGSLASVSTSGLVSALKPGSATITATFSSVSGSTIITAANRTLQSIVVTPVNASITSGQKQQFQATANYADGTTQDVSASAHWSSSSANTVTINSGQNGGGLATAKAAGTVIITATLNGVSGSTNATVN
jgi:uncharacterized protein YjdB